MREGKGGKTPYSNIWGRDFGGEKGNPLPTKKIYSQPIILSCHWIWGYPH